VKQPAWAVVPAKCPARGKSRLRPILGDEERTRFARELLEHVLDVLAASRLFEGILVATECDEVSDLASARGATVERDGEPSSLAAVVDRALARVTERGAIAAIVLMADLPRIAVDDVRQLLAALEGHDVVLVRDHKGQHTNALAMAPPMAVRTCFGRDDSFAAHCAAVSRAGLRLGILDNAQIAFDVDAPVDLSGLRRRAET
jgi:2-phospho-L-lactate guanylyltransferase